MQARLRGIGLAAVVWIVAALAACSAAVAAYEESGAIDGAPYRIRVPDRWNGTLLVYAEGYRDRASRPDESENRQPNVASDLTITNDGQMEEPLLRAGYALAGSAYRSNGVVLEGRADLLALIAHFRTNVARLPQVRAGGILDHTVLLACSMGSWFSYGIGEQQLPAVDGVVSVGGGGGGLQRTADWLLAFQLAYDELFGWPATWGEVGDVRDDVDWELDALPVVAAQAADPRNLARFEFLRLVLGEPFEGFYPGTTVHPGNVPWVYGLAYLGTEVAADAELHLGGLGYQNTDHVYSLSDSDVAHLHSIDPAFDPAPVLAAMNARRTFAAEVAVRDRAQAGFGFSSTPRVPVLTMKNRADGLLPTWHDALYRDEVAAAGAAGNLLQVYVDASSHCGFTPPQVLTAVSAMDFWLRTGRRPRPASFPRLFGFLPDYAPPRWPFSAR